MFNIRIDTIPHSNQRYNTVGDWYYDETLRVPRIFVSQMSDWKYEFLVGLHEMVEWVLCSTSNITPKQVDEWDMSHAESDDPGSIIECPYFYQHKTAVLVEKIVCHIMNIDWNVYEDEIERVSLTYKTKLNEKKEGQASA